MRTGPRDLGSAGGSGGAWCRGHRECLTSPPYGQSTRRCGPSMGPIIVVHHGWGRSCDNLDQPRLRESRWRQAMPELASGTDTFLFTDIEGSTALWERDQ